MSWLIGGVTVLALTSAFALAVSHLIQRGRKKPKGPFRDEFDEKRVRGGRDG